MARNPTKRRLSKDDINESLGFDVDGVQNTTTTTPLKAKRVRTNGSNGDNGFHSWHKWTVDKVAQELENYGLPDVGQTFKEHEISGHLLPSITEKRLDEMGIRVVGKKLSTLKFLKELHPDTPLSPSKDTKVFNDPIHGHIELHPVCIKIIDTPQFQRLRNIKQLGGCYFVFPGGSHNRFEHSIGVCYLAGEMTRAIKWRQPELGVTEVDILCLQIAGLCHDLGHGPFSHLFDQCFIPKVLPGCSWRHEKASVQMLEYLMKDNDLEGFFHDYGVMEKDIVFIKELVDGPCNKRQNEKEWSFKGRGKDKNFLYEIVANKRNGIDVDKWDYFARDCHGLGISNNFDHNRFIKFARVLEVDGCLQICSKDKEASNLYDMFHTRQTLHRRAYQHAVNKVVEAMITEAFVKANDHIKFSGKGGKQLKMSEAIYDMEAYSKMTDFVFEQILLSDKPDLRDAQNILRRLQKRQLYKCVGQSQPQPDKKITESDIPQFVDELWNILQLLEHDGIGVNKDDLMMHVVSIDYGMKNDNPIDHVRFYSKQNPTVAVRVRKHQVSQMLPDTFSEQILRLLTKSLDEEVIGKVGTAFQMWCNQNENLMKKAKMGKVSVEMTPLLSSQGSVGSEPFTPQKEDEKEMFTAGTSKKCRSKLEFDGD